jgi:hypothetical protein
MALSEEDFRKIRGLMNAAIQTAFVTVREQATKYTNKEVAMMISDERERLAALIENFAPISETEHHDVLVPKGEIVNWRKTLAALADAIRKGRQE